VLVGFDHRDKGGEVGRHLIGIVQVAAQVLSPSEYADAAARARVFAGLDEITRAALERAGEKVLEDSRPPRDKVVALAYRR
jgi:hypothetical protein